jgi:hypothetical protein
MKACSGCRAAITTASSLRSRFDLERIERDGNLNLIEAAMREKVGHFVFVAYLATLRGRRLLIRFPIPGRNFQVFLSHPKPQLTLEIFFPSGEEQAIEQGVVLSPSLPPRAARPPAVRELKDVLLWPF